MDERKKNNLFYVVITIFNLGFATTTREGAVSSFHSCDSIIINSFCLIEHILVGGIVTHASRITCQHILVRLANSILGRWSLGHLVRYFLHALGRSSHLVGGAAGDAAAGPTAATAGCTAGLTTGPAAGPAARPTTKAAARLSS